MLNEVKSASGGRIKILFTGLFICVSITIFAQGTWTQKTDFGGTARFGAVGFSIGTKAYIGTGVDMSLPRKDFWEYDPVGDSWTQKADFGGTARWIAIGFSIGAKGYIGTGYDGLSSYKDFWEYDPAGNTWTQKTDFGGTARSIAVGFSLLNKGYIGTGYDISFSPVKDFWQYDPAGDTWTQKTDFGGVARYGAVGFSIETLILQKGYIGTGYDDTNYLKDFWEYDAGSDTWTQKADFGGTARDRAVGFSIGDKGYIGTGDDNSFLKDFWEYNQGNNTWTQKLDFGGAVRQGSVGFSIASAKGYIGIGWDSDAPTYYKDFWEYDPSGLGISNDAFNNIRFSVSPNPFSARATIQYHLPVTAEVNFTLYNLYGQRVGEILSSKESAGEHTLTLNAEELNIPNGMYLLEMRTGEKKQYQKIVCVR